MKLGIMQEKLMQTSYNGFADKLKTGALQAVQKTLWQDDLTAELFQIILSKNHSASNLQNYILCLIR